MILYENEKFKNDQTLVAKIKKMRNKNKKYP